MLISYRGALREPVACQVEMAVHTKALRYRSPKPSLPSTGDQPTDAGRKTLLSAVARTCGYVSVIAVQGVDLGPVLQAAIEGKKQTVIVCKCESGNIKLSVITIDPVIIRDRLMKAVARQNGVTS